MAARGIGECVIIREKRAIRHPPRDSGFERVKKSTSSSRGAVRSTASRGMDARQRLAAILRGAPQRCGAPQDDVEVIFCTRFRRNDTESGCRCSGSISPRSALAANCGTFGGGPSRPRMPGPLQEDTAMACAGVAACVFSGATAGGSGVGRLHFDWLGALQHWLRYLSADQTRSLHHQENPRARGLIPHARALRARLRRGAGLDRRPMDGC
jgi:hypothetical protein